ncbi:Hypothetical protein, putative [Bodo saltans]|uniref:Uncharacterized protein n=1 Tax=Bodo saltans TaxID=75058 RepID=A0A0S4KHK8_BODSA|nr:Hypothetical protein, putative [Bodo saltans]|eukprot:CUI15166.1 Hypothetical protein, putative [Bodo saltans]
MIQQKATGGSQTPRRIASPSRSEAGAHPSPYRRQPSPLMGSSSYAITVRKDATPSLSLFTGRAPSLNGLPQAQGASTSRASSPGRASQVSSVAPARPRVAGLTTLRTGVTTPRSGRPEFK